MHRRLTNERTIRESRIANACSDTVVQGKGYDLTAGEGQRIWMECLAPVLSHPLRADEAARSALQVREMPLIDIAGGYGAPTTIRPRASDSAASASRSST